MQNLWEEIQRFCRWICSVLEIEMMSRARTQGFHSARLLTQDSVNVTDRICVIYCRVWRRRPRAMRVDCWARAPDTPTALCIRVLWELSNHEEQLSRPASWCAHGSAAVSGLLRHQMAVSILGGGGSPPSLHCLTSHSNAVENQATSRRRAALFAARCSVLWERRARDSLEKGPSIPRVAERCVHVCLMKGTVD